MIEVLTILFCIAAAWFLWNIIVGIVITGVFIVMNVLTLIVLAIFGLMSRG